MGVSWDATVERVTGRKTHGMSGDRIDCVISMWTHLHMGIAREPPETSVKFRTADISAPTHARSAWVQR